jgi:AcrR family transcriptional regulator
MGAEGNVPDQMADFVDRMPMKSRVVDAASRAIIADGLAADVGDIARQAAVGVDVVNDLFPTLNALVNAVVRQFLADCNRIVEDCAGVPDGHGLETFLYATGDLGATRGRLFTFAHAFDSHTAETILGIRAGIPTLLTNAQHHGRIKSDITPTDVDDTVRTMLSLIDRFGRQAPGCWRRWLAITLAGMRPGTDDLTTPPLTEAESTRVIATKFL